MVQVITPFSPAASLGQNLGQGIGQGFNQGLEQSSALGIQKFLNQQDASAIQQALMQSNGDPQSAWQALLSAPISDQAKKLALGALQNQMELQQRQQIENQKLQQKNDLQRQNLLQSGIEDQKTREVLSENFGDRFADLFLQSPVGGRTELLKNAIEATQRGQNIEDLLSRKVNPKEEEKLEDFDKGLTPRERIKRQEDRYGKNLPLFQEDEKKYQGLVSEQDALGVLKQLNDSESLPEGLGRLNVNFKTGELIIPALSSPEAQRYVKTINDFTTRAKDSYGSRVTNFDLQQFMKRLPTLANSKEGRDLILDQMELINGINIGRANALRDIVEEYGGIRNIDYDKAERLAEKKAKPEVQKLRSQFTKNEKQLNSMFDDEKKELRKNVPKGQVMVQSPDGSIGSIPISELKDALEEGYERL